MRRGHAALTPVYQKVVPPPIFALLLELTALSEAEPAAAATPAAVQAFPDIDEDSPAPAPVSPASGNGGSGTSDWETLTDEA